MSPNEYYYQTIFEHFKQNLNDSKYLIIIGYSFRDTEINKIINDNFLNSDDKRIIVIDPHMPKVEEFISSGKIYKIGKSISLVTLKELTECL